MKCPRCDSNLEAESYEGVEIDRCIDCKGSWLDEGELTRIIITKEEHFSEELLQETLATAFTGVPQDEKRSIERCPKCQRAMVAINYDYSSGIIVDRCPDGHGLWMDGGELEKAQIHREHYQAEAEKNLEDWIALGAAVEDGKREAADETSNRNMRPTRYLVNAFIRKLLGG